MCEIKEMSWTHYELATGYYSCYNGNSWYGPVETEYNGGKVMVTKDMSIGQVLAMDSKIAQVFLRFGMHCLGCPHATAESLEMSSAVHGIDVDSLVEALNNYLAAAK